MPNDPSDLEAVMIELSGLTTERAHLDRGDLDLLPTEQLVSLMNLEDTRVPLAVAERRTEIASAVDGIVNRMRAGGRLIYLGAGTAGRIGVLDASECPPTFGTDPSLVVGLIAGGPEAIRTAVEGSEDDTAAAVRDLESLGLTPQDTVVGVSASGRTPFVVAGLRFARTVGALTVALACNPNSVIGAIAEIPIEVVVGPEFVAGSTRLKAGTAQKMILNMLSTLTMVRLGKTYNGVMVDLKATNKKLRARSLRTVMAATGVDAGQATDALRRAEGSVKLAILLLLTDLTPEQGRSALAGSDGVLRTAIARSR